MIRLNLLKHRISLDFRPVKMPAIKALAAIFFVQILVYWHVSSENQKNIEAVKLLQKKVEVLEERRKEFLAQIPPEGISGAIQERNDWLGKRAKSPVFVLARLEKDLPPNVECKTFDSGDTGGSLQVRSPDMDTATQFLNGVLGTKNVRITMVDRVPTGIIAACTWNE